MDDEQDQPVTREAGLRRSLRRVVLLRETGPKSAAWHRARVATIWRLHRLLERADESAPEETPPRARGQA
jgi:hypothetical protein